MGGFECLELVLYGIRVLAEQHSEPSRPEWRILGDNGDLTRVLCVGCVGDGWSWPGEETGDVVVSREEGAAR